MLALGGFQGGSESGFCDPHISSISRRRSVLLGPGRFGRRRRSPRRRWSSLPPVGQRLVGPVAKDVAEACDRGAELGEGGLGERTGRKTGNGRCRFVATKPIQEGGEDRQRSANHGDIARSMVIADGQFEVPERGQRVAV